ncbi:MAG: ATP-binding cassette domain-containing protein [Micromonosporaceae bacterium]|nr:ATP-binding cassette domain-containing protein [Micromonosporaceae bacterium]
MGHRWRVRQRLAASQRLRALRLLVHASPALALAAGGFVLAEAVLPNLTLVAMGRVTGEIPAAVRSGLGSVAGHRLEWTLGIAGLLYAVFMLRGPVQDVLNAVVRARMTTVLQARLVDAVSTPPGIEHLENPEVLDRLASARGDLMGQRPADAPMTVLNVVGSRLSGVGACAVIAAFRWWLGLLLVLVWLVVRRPLLAMVAERVATFRAASEPLRRSWYLGSLATRSTAAKEVRVFGLADWLLRGYRETWLVAMRPQWTRDRRTSRLLLAVGALVFAAYAVATATVGWAGYRHQVALGTLATILPLLPATMAVGSLTVNDYRLAIMLSALPDLDALTADLAPPADLVPRAASAGAAARPAVGLPEREIRFSSVSLRYPGAERDVLSGLDLTLPAGESLGLVGVNGAGKTTLVTLLARLRDPTGGLITVDGVPLAGLPAREWQRQVAVVYQDFTRLPLTARENVSMLLFDEPVDVSALDEAAQRAGAAELVTGLPGGWETVLSPQYAGGTDLSGGQWQRIALARALYAVQRGARVLVLDEPTAHLDVRAEAAFYDRFLQITQGVTSVVISHRFATVRRANRIAVLDGGRITELGSHDELVAAGGLYARMFGQQAARFDRRAAGR